MPRDTESGMLPDWHSVRPDTSSDIDMVMSRLKKVFSSPELESVARDKPPRSTISDALVAAFCDLVDVVQPDMVLEIGAHEAAFSCEMKCRMPQAEILAFEANPHVYAIFEEKLRATGGVTYVWQAISDQDADVELFIPTSVGGFAKPLHNRMGSLNLLNNRSAAASSVTVPGRTLDGALGARAGKTSAIWIDVEGAVDRVLTGAAATMRQAQAVMCELETATMWAGQMTESDVLARFRRFGLVPVLRDCQAKIQYNVVLLHERWLSSPEVVTRIRKFSEQAEMLLAPVVKPKAPEAARTLFLHVGPAKTGTSAVQYVLSKHDNSRITYPKIGLWADGSHHNLVFNFYGDTTRPEVRTEDGMAMLGAIAAEARERSGNIIISSEALVSRDIGAFAQALLGQIGGSPCAVEIILVCREHYARAASLYNQDVKDSVTMERQLPGEFLARFAARHSYTEMIRKLTWFGFNIRVLNYHPSESFVPRFLQHIGFPPDETTGNEPRNISLSVKGMIATLAANSVAATRDDRARYFAALRRMSNFFAQSQFIFSAESVAECEPAFREDRDFLRQEYGIDLPAPDAQGPRDMFFLTPMDLADIASATKHLGADGTAITRAAANHLRD